MTSAEPGGTSAYSADVAVRVVWQRLGMGMSFRDIAKRLQIGTHRLYRRFTETGDFKKAERSCRRHTRKLDEFHELYIIGLLMENPGLYLNEMKLKIKEVTTVTVSGSTICRVLQRNGYTRKKILQVARQRCTEFRGLFMAEVLQYPRDFFVWVDETRSDNRDQIRKFGYALRGLPPVYHRLLVRGTRISTIAAIGCEGLVTFEMITGTTNGETFFDFIRGSVIPRMHPFPAPSSVLVMDNCSIHHIQEVKDILVQAGTSKTYLLTVLSSTQLKSCLVM